jgi:hypothetical protein
MQASLVSSSSGTAEPEAELARVYRMRENMLSGENPAQVKVIFY